MRRIDILGVPWEEMPAALIYFTGNEVSFPSLTLLRESFSDFWNPFANSASTAPYASKLDMRACH